jgi:hypothetical protein
MAGKQTSLTSPSQDGCATIWRCLDKARVVVIPATLKAMLDATPRRSLATPRRGLVVLVNSDGPSVGRRAASRLPAARRVPPRRHRCDISRATRRRGHAPGACRYGWVLRHVGSRSERQDYPEIQKMTAWKFHLRSTFSASEPVRYFFQLRSALTQLRMTDTSISGGDDVRSGPDLAMGWGLGRGSSPKGKLRPP